MISLVKALPDTEGDSFSLTIAAVDGGSEHNTGKSEVQIGVVRFGEPEFDACTPSSIDVPEDTTGTVLGLFMATAKTIATTNDASEAEAGEVSEATEDAGEAADVIDCLEEQCSTDFASCLDDDACGLLLYTGRVPTYAEAAAAGDAASQLHTCYVAYCYAAEGGDAASEAAGEAEGEAAGEVSGEATEDGATEDVIDCLEERNLTDSDMIEYSIVDGNVGEVFTIDAATGELMVSGGLDRETIDEYKLVVRATDYGALRKSSDVGVLIVVTDVNDNHPIFTKAEYIRLVLEDAVVNSVVGVAQAVDLDTEGRGKVTYAFEAIDSSGEVEGSGPPLADYADVFAIGSETGIVTLLQPLLEVPGDLFTLRIEASDAGDQPLQAHTLMEIRVLRYSPPVFNSDSPTQLHVEENKFTVVGTVNAIADHIQTDQTVRYEIISAIGLVSVAQPQAQAPAWKHCADETEMCTCQTYIRYKGVYILSASSGTTWECSDDTFGTPIQATSQVCECLEIDMNIDMQTLDVDGPFPFELDQASGELQSVNISTGNMIDRERFSKFILTIQATDSSTLNKSSTKNFTIAVDGISDNAPQWFAGNTKMKTTIREDHIGPFASVAATDIDRPQVEVIYTIEFCKEVKGGGGGGRGEDEIDVGTVNFFCSPDLDDTGNGERPIVIDPVTGVLKAVTLDGLSKSSHEIKVVATKVEGSNHAQSSIQFTVDVTLVPSLRTSHFQLYLEPTMQVPSGSGEGTFATSCRDTNAQFVIVNASDNVHGVWEYADPNSEDWTRLIFDSLWPRSKGVLFDKLHKFRFVPEDPTFAGVGWLRFHAYNGPANVASTSAGSEHLNVASRDGYHFSEEGIMYAFIAPSLPTPLVQVKQVLLPTITDDITSVANAGSSIAEMLGNAVTFSDYPLSNAENRSNPDRVVGCDMPGCNLTALQSIFPIPFEALMPTLDRAVLVDLATLSTDLGEWQWAPTPVSEWVAVSILPDRLAKITGRHTWDTRRKLWTAPAVEESSGYLRLSPISSKTGTATLSCQAWQGKFNDSFARFGESDPTALLDVKITVTRTERSPILDDQAVDSSTGAVMMTRLLALELPEVTTAWPKATSVNSLVNDLAGAAIIGAWNCIDDSDGNCVEAGLWQYSLGGDRRRGAEDSADWFAFPSQVSEGAAVILPEAGFIRFVPNPNMVWNADDSKSIRLRYRGWDGSGNYRMRNADARYQSLGAFTAKTMDVSVLRPPCCGNTVEETYARMLSQPNSTIDLVAEDYGCDYSAPYQSPSQIGGGGVVDLCGVCGGNDADKDCAGVCFGTATINSCELCVGGSTGLATDAGEDCNGDCGGDAEYDGCGVCAGGNTDVQANKDVDCANVCRGTSRLVDADSEDVCQRVCGPPTGQSYDCAGVCFGGALEDGCGDCSGHSSKNPLFKEFNPMACLAGAASGAVVSPTSSPASGGVTINLVGSGFVINPWEFHTLRQCRFKHTETQDEYFTVGTIISKDELRCLSPTVEDAGSYDLHVTLDGTNFILMAKDFRFVADGSTSTKTTSVDFTFNSISPSLVPAGGTTLVSITCEDSSDTFDTEDIWCIGVGANIGDGAAVGSAEVAADGKRIECTFATPVLGQEFDVYISTGFFSYMATGLKLHSYNTGPRLLSATLLASGAGIVAKFDSPVAFEDGSNCGLFWDVASRATLGIADAASSEVHCTVSDDMFELTMIVYRGVTTRAGELLVMAAGIVVPAASATLLRGTASGLFRAGQKYALPATGAQELQAPAEGFVGPVAQLRAPSHLQICEGSKTLVLDGSWSSPMGGPPMIYEWSVEATSDDADMSELSSYLANEATGIGKNIVELSTDLLPEGTDFIFELYVTSHYVVGRSRVATQLVVVSDATYPEVTLHGPPTRSVDAAQDAVEISLEIQTPCHAATEGVGIMWQLIPAANFEMPTGVTSLTIPAGALKAEMSYQIAATVWSKASPTFASTTYLTVNTVKKAANLVLVGGDLFGGSRLVGVATSVALVATSASESASYLWQCAYGHSGTTTSDLPCLRTDDDGEAESFQLNAGERLFIPAGTAFPGIYYLSVVVQTGGGDEGTSMLTTKIEYILEDVPSVSIKATFKGTEARVTGSRVWNQATTINAGEKLTIIASVDSRMAATGVWSAVDDAATQSASLTSSFASTAITGISIPADDTNEVPLVYDTDGLAPGTYRFRLTASNSNGAGHADLTVVVNTPPSIGVLHEIPESTVETSSTSGTVRYTPGGSDVTLSTSGWNARDGSGGDYPLRFRFGCAGDDGETQWLGPVSSRPTATRWLPARATSVFVVAVDADGASSDPVVAPVVIRTNQQLQLMDVAQHAADLAARGQWEEATSKLHTTLVGLNDQVTNPDLVAMFIGDAPAFRDDAAQVVERLVTDKEVFMSADNVDWLIAFLDVLVPADDVFTKQKVARSSVATILAAITNVWMTPSELANAHGLAARGITTADASRVVELFSRVLQGYGYDTATEQVREVYVEVMEMLPGLLCRTATLAEDAMTIEHALGSISSSITDTFDGEIPGASSQDRPSSLKLGSELQKQFKSWSCDTDDDPTCQGICVGVSVFPEDLTAAHFDQASEHLATVIQRVGLYNQVTGLSTTGISIGDDTDTIPRQWLPLLESVVVPLPENERRGGRAVDDVGESIEGEELELPDYECRYFDAESRRWETNGCTFFVLDGNHIECRCSVYNVYVAGFYNVVVEPSASASMAPAGQYFRLLTVEMAPGHYEVNAAWEATFITAFSKAVASLLLIDLDRIAEATIVSVTLKTDVISPGSEYEEGNGVISVEFKLLSESQDTTAGAVSSADALVELIAAGVLLFDTADGNAYLASSASDVTPATAVASSTTTIVAALGMACVLGIGLMLWWMNRSHKHNQIGMDKFADSDSDSTYEGNRRKSSNTRFNMIPTDQVSVLGSVDAAAIFTAKRSVVPESPANIQRRMSGQSLLNSTSESPGPDRRVSTTSPPPPRKVSSQSIGRGSPTLVKKPLDPFASIDTHQSPPPVGGGGMVPGRRESAGLGGEILLPPINTPTSTGDAAATEQPVTDRASTTSVELVTAAAAATAAGDLIEAPARTCICGKPAELGCTRCRGAFYCSAECQRKDWKDHRVECKKTAAKRRAMGALRAINAVGKPEAAPAFVPSQHKPTTSTPEGGATPTAGGTPPTPQRPMLTPGERRTPSTQFGGPPGGPRPRSGGVGVGPPGGTPGPRGPIGGQPSGMRPPSFGPPQGGPGRAGPAGFNPRSGPGLGGPGSPMRGPSGPGGPGGPGGPPRGPPGGPGGPPGMRGMGRPGGAPVGGPRSGGPPGGGPPGGPRPPGVNGFPQMRSSPSPVASPEAAAETEA
jgi:hypothetical protein